MISIADLSVTYPTANGEVLAIEGISLNIDAGDIFTIIGPSGCGKSTLLYVLSGIIRKFSGSVLIDGVAVNPRQQRIGLILQNYGLLPWKNVADNVLLGQKIKNGRLIWDDYSRYIVEQLSITDILNRYPKELSGGQQQRVAIARAFILKPDLLLMDEPFSALDAITREEMQELFLGIWEEHRVTTLFITHSVDEALFLGKKITVLSAAPGRIVEVVENPCFQMENRRFNDEYNRMSKYLRNLLKKG